MAANALHMFSRFPVTVTNLEGEGLNGLSIVTKGLKKYHLSDDVLLEMFIRAPL